jgi:hypothetical protein
MPDLDPDLARGVAHEILARIGKLIGEAASNSNRFDPRFCVLIPFGVGWESLVVVDNSYMKAKVEVMIDYDNLPIRCKFCYDTSHYFKDCS